MPEKADVEHSCPHDFFQKQKELLKKTTNKNKMRSTKTEKKKRIFQSKNINVNIMYEMSSMTWDQRLFIVNIFSSFIVLNSFSFVQQCTLLVNRYENIYVYLWMKIVMVEGILSDKKIGSEKKNHSTLPMQKLIVTWKDQNIFYAFFFHLYTVHVICHCFHNATSFYFR